MRWENDPHRFQIVLGPRRVGKTTALYQTVRHLIADRVPPSRIWWLRLDHPLLLQADLGALVRDAWPVRVAATSSAAAALRERRLESRVGRWSEQHLTPYLFDDFLDLIGEDVASMPARPWRPRSGPSTRTSPSRSVSTAR